MSSGFITAALKLEGTIPVESGRFISERIAGPSLKKFLKNFGRERIQQSGCWF